MATHYGTRIGSSKSAGPTAWRPFDLATDSTVPDTPEPVTIFAGLSQPLCLATPESSTLFDRSLISSFDTNVDLEEAVDADLPLLDTKLSVDQPVDSPIEGHDWLLDYGSTESHYHTWEDFGVSNIVHSQSKYLSGLPGPVYNAALSRSGLGSSKIIPQPIMLNAIHSVMDGRSSSFFQWDPQKGQFHSVLDNSISGLSSMVSQALVEDLTRQGSLFRRLKGCRPSSTAFKTSLNTCLACIEDWLSASSSSLLQAQHLSHKIASILELLWQMHNDIVGMDENEMIEYLHHKQVSLISSGSIYATLVISLRQTITQPWLKRLLEDCLTDTPYKPISHLQQTDQDLLKRAKQNMLYLRKHVPERLAAIAPSNFAGPDMSRVAGSRHAVNALSTDFASNHVAYQSSRESVSNAARKASNESASSDANYESLQEPASHHAAFESSQLAFDEADYSSTPGRTELRLTISELSNERKSTAQMPTKKQTALTLADKEQEAQKLAGEQSTTVRADQEPSASYSTSWRAFEFNTDIKEPSTEPEPADVIITATQQLLDGRRQSAQPVVYPALTTHQPLLIDPPVDSITPQHQALLLYDPLAGIRSQIEQQVQVTSQAVMEHLFVGLDLKTHLDLRYKYMLCGDADFVDRLRTAIFGSIDTTVDTLNLNDLSKVDWPPRTSKLSLNLMSILNDTTTVSFTVRQLPEEKMELACDAASIHALDFLQLKIETPPALDFVGSAEYDQIFASLLLHTRMLHLTTKLRRSGDSPRIVNRIHHVVTTLASYATQLAVALPWKEFMNSLQHMKTFDELKDTHTTCLLRIRSRLFLRQKQSKIKNAVEAFFDLVLLFAKNGCTDLQVSKLIEDLVRRLADYVEALERAVGSDEGETELVRILLSQLSVG